MWGPKQEKVRKPLMSLAFHFSIFGFPACGCQKMSVVYETECRHAAVQRGKQDQIIYSH